MSCRVALPCRSHKGARAACEDLRQQRERARVGRGKAELESERPGIGQPLVDIRIQIRDLILDDRAIKHFFKVVAEHRRRSFIWPIQHKHRLFQRPAFLRKFENLRNERAAVLPGLVQIKPHPAFGGHHVFLKRRYLLRRGLSKRIAQIEPLCLLKRHVSDIPLSVRHPRDMRIVQNHKMTVLRAPHVRLDDIDPAADCVFKRGKGILRRELPVRPVARYKHAVRSHRTEGQRGQHNRQSRRQKSFHLFIPFFAYRLLAL